MNRISHPHTRLACVLAWLVLSTSVQAELFPHAGLYPVYIADPLRPTFNAQYQSVDTSTIASTGDRRFDLKLGGNLPLCQMELGRIPWQLVLIAGFHGVFDNTRSQDNIGWDGIYGLHVAGQLNDRWSIRFGSKHISAHVGDEYIENTGRTRLNYTREEFRIGLAAAMTSRWLLYGEIAHAYDERNIAIQRPWRAQLGTQYVAPLTMLQKPIDWYVALDLSSYEENDWDRNVTVQAGVATGTGTHTWRLGVEYYDGRAQLGEFFQAQERYWSLGVWFDL